MRSSITLSKPAQEKQKKTLRNLIEKKRGILENWNEKVEELKMDLDLIRHEYHVRVGGLILKDNQLDLEILQLRNLQDLMKDGMSYGQAIKSQEDAFYNDILRMQKEQEEIDTEKEMLDKRDTVSIETEEAVRKLWKQLIRKFHPDLVTDPEEKVRRETLMKKINQAYALFDIEALKQIQYHSHVESIDEVSIERLEQILVGVENMILELIFEYKELRLSEWYNWKIKKEKTAKKGEIKEDIFAAIEKDLLDEIVKKIAILQKLRVEVIPQNTL